MLDAVFVQLNIGLQFLLDSIAFYSHFSQDGLCLQREIRHVISFTLQIIQGKIDPLLTDRQKNKHTDKTPKQRDTLISRLRMAERSTSTDLDYARNRKKALSFAVAPAGYSKKGMENGKTEKGGASVLFFFIPIAPCALSVFPLPSPLKTQRGLGQREERLTVNGSRTGGAGLSYLSHIYRSISIMNTVIAILTRKKKVKVKVVFREIKSHVHDKRQTSDSSLEFLRIENKQI